MSRIIVLNIFRALTGLIALSVCPSVLAETPRGWFVRVCHVDRPPLELKLSFPTQSNDLKNWRTWSPGQPTEFQFPLEYRYAAEVTLWGYGQNKQVDMCFGYNDHPVQRMSFDETEKH